ncbi:outer membrane lipid asymmetry maintenance protein MlaD [uncultured Cardiobacterium sp.]|uniref:outer membrane lipid asymmetry maintenance protein MlaD n=1 Tax=uncultured Cardiobacterium sp. TaxID=417619 RepID=UPI00260A44E4|nr:outer membrane lipid asymmetry maintenance protein MlaD [uncultured Cardiobacterium sp.]
MQSNRSISVAVGLFVLLALAGMVFLALQASNARGFRMSHPYQVNADFADISGLSKNAKVTMAGVQIGKVKSIGYDQETYKAKVVLEISGEYDRLPLDSSADILTAGLLGEKYIGVVPGGDPAMLQNGDTIQYTGSSMVLEKLIQQFVTQMSAKDDASKTTTQESSP